MNECHRTLFEHVFGLRNAKQFIGKLTCFMALVSELVIPHSLRSWGMMGTILTSAASISPSSFGFPLAYEPKIIASNEVTGVNRAVFDINYKPPGTIEWE